MTSSESGSIGKNPNSSTANNGGRTTAILPSPSNSNNHPSTGRPNHGEFAVSTRTLDSVKIAKVTLENYYNNLVTQWQDRQNRCANFNMTFSSIHAFPIHITELNFTSIRFTGQTPFCCM